MGEAKRRGTKEQRVAMAKPKPTEYSFSLKLDKLTSVNEPEEYSAGLIGWVIGAGGTLLLFGLATFIYMMCGVYFSN